MPVTSRPPQIAGNSVNAIVPSAEVSTGHPKSSPPGMFAPPASTSIRRPAMESVRSVPSPTIRTSSAASKSVA